VVAKHCPIIPLLPTTTNQQPPAAAVAAAPRKCPHGPSEGALIANADAHPLQAHPSTSPRVCPSPPRGMWANDTPRHRPIPRHLAHCQRQPRTATSPVKGPAYATSQPSTTPTRHLTTQNRRVRHVTDDDDPHHSQQQGHPPRHHHQRRRQVKTAASPLLEGCRRRNRRVGARRCDREERWSAAAREWGTRRQGKRRGKEEGIHASSFLFSLFFSNGGSTCCPRIFSFHFERGQHTPPPFLFISFRTGAATAAPVSFLFVSNGDGTRRPQFFSFRTGAALAAPVSFLSVSNGGAA
jgi:hypothetical protein